MTSRAGHAIEHLQGVPVLAVAATIVTWGLASPLLKLASLDAPALGFYRLWIGVIVLFAIVLRGGRPISRSAMRWAALAGALFGANMLFFLLGIKHTTVANATLIGALQPAIVLLVAGRWFGETVSAREAACVAIAMLGVGIVIVGSTGAPEWHIGGDALALMAVLTFTAYFLISKQARTSVGTLEYMAGVHLVAAIVVTPLALARPAELRPQDAQDVAIVLFFALVSGTAGQVIIGWAHRYVDVSLSSLMMLGVPVVAALAAWAILDEELVPLQIAGGIVTLIAIAVMLRRPAMTSDAGWKSTRPESVALASDGT